MNNEFQQRFQSNSLQKAKKFQQMVVGTIGQPYAKISTLKALTHHLQKLTCDES